MSAFESRLVRDTTSGNVCRINSLHSSKGVCVADEKQFKKRKKNGKGEICSNSLKKGAKII